MTFIGALVEILITPVAAFAGTVVGNTLRALLISGREPRPEPTNGTAEDLVITGVLTNAALAAIAAWMAGKGRTVTAFLGGLLLSFVTGDRFDRTLLPATGRRSPRALPSPTSDSPLLPSPAQESQTLP